LPLAALAFRRGWLLGLSLVFIFVPDQSAYAWELKDLWINKDTQGTTAFEEENYAEAATLFEDDAWRAAANYRTGNFENAVADLNLLEDAESHYNRGNALARLNRFPEAISAYEEVLAMAPDHEDAQYNKELLEKLMEEQQQEQQQQQQNSEGDNQEQEQQEGDEQQDQQQQQNQDQQTEQSDQDQQQEQEQEQNQDQQESDQDSESEPQEQEMPEPQEGEEPDSEEEQAMQQWLRRIPDDPGELLRRKFQYQAARRRFEEIQNPNLATQEGNDEIW